MNFYIVKGGSEDVVGFIKTRSTVLLKVLPVKLRIDDKVTKVLAFLDDGSMYSISHR